MRDWVTPSVQKLFRFYCPGNDFYYLTFKNTSMQYDHMQYPAYFFPERLAQRFEHLDKPGHMSLFMFDQRHLDFYYDHPDSWTGFQFETWSNFMFWDIDKDGSFHVEGLKRHFADYDWLLYKSGGGDQKYHFVLPHNRFSSHKWHHIYGTFAQAAQVPADKSLWFPLGTMSLPGYIHPDTGIRKELIATNSGKVFQFPTELDTGFDYADFALQFFGWKGKQYG